MGEGGYSPGREKGERMVLYHEESGVSMSAERPVQAVQRAQRQCSREAGQRGQQKSYQAQLYRLYRLWHGILILI